jgi:hypothetical protein
MKKKVYKVTFRVSLANTWLAVTALILAAFSSEIRQQYLIDGAALRHAVNPHRSCTFPVVIPTAQKNVEFVGKCSVPSEEVTVIRRRHKID